MEFIFTYYMKYADGIIDMTMSNSFSNTPRLTITNTAISQNNHPNTATTATIPVVRSTIDDFREIIREQSFVIHTNSESTSPDVPIKRYPPLPDISVPTGTFINPTVFRTETVLASPGQTQSKKQVFNHFASTQRGHLPALKKSSNLPTISSAMDLDEDLPQSKTNIPHRAATYTSPGDRIISPIKRPSAPSPPSSAQIKRPGHHAFVNGEEDEEEDEEDLDGEQSSRFTDEDSHFFNEHFYHYQQPVIMSNRRIDHYNHTNRHLQSTDRHPTIIINDGNDESIHPLDSTDFEP